MNATSRSKWVIGTIATLGIVITTAISYRDADPVRPEQPMQREDEVSVAETIELRPIRPSPTVDSASERKERPRELRNATPRRPLPGRQPVKPKAKEARPLG